MKTLYEVLRVEETASEQEIKIAYRKLAAHYHPDVFWGSKEYAEEIMKEINYAYTVLSNPESRRSYDEELRRQRVAETQEDKQQAPEPAGTAAHAAKNSGGGKSSKFRGRWGIIILCILAVIVTCVIFSGVGGCLSSDEVSTNAGTTRRTAITTQATEARYENAYETVYVTESGEKYHRSYCQYLRNSKIPITLKDAVGKGYGRCSKCNPPILINQLAHTPVENPSVPPDVEKEQKENFSAIIRCVNGITLVPNDSTQSIALLKEAEKRVDSLYACNVVRNCEDIHTDFKQFKSAFDYWNVSFILFSMELENKVIDSETMNNLGNNYDRAMETAKTCLEDLKDALLVAQEDMS